LENPEEFMERPEKPVKSTAILEQHLDSVTITLPALGLRRSWSSFLATGCGFSEILMRNFQR
jgi:hypothetical protein